MLQTDRRRDPYPFTWEIPVGVLAAVLISGMLGVQVGRSLAHWFAGAGWHWPTGRALLTSTPAILTGHPTAGLNLAPVPVASAGAVVGWIVATEVVLCIALFAVAILALRRWGPARMKGMATPSEAEATLGISRLRKQRRIIRPDLYPPRQHPRWP
jgi:hypothetical protein